MFLGDSSAILILEGGPMVPAWILLDGRGHRGYHSLGRRGKFPILAPVPWPVVHLSISYNNIIM